VSLAKALLQGVVLLEEVVALAQDLVVPGNDGQSGFNRKLEASHRPSMYLNFSTSCELCSPARNALSSSFERLLKKDHR